MVEDYRGLPAGFVFALRRSDSWLLRTYVVASVIVGGFAAVLLALALVSWLGTPAPLGGRSLLGVIGIFVFVPLFAPVLVAARRHRRGAGSRRADALLGLTGYGFVLAVYLALLISDPNPHAVDGPIAPAIAAVDALPRVAWIVPPLLAVGGIYAAVRYTRPTIDEAEAPPRGTADPDEAEG